MYVYIHRTIFVGFCCSFCSSIVMIRKDPIKENASLAAMDWKVRMEKIKKSKTPAQDEL